MKQNRIDHEEEIKMNQRERMLSELPYKAWEDGLEEERKEAENRFTAITICLRRRKRRKMR